MHFFWENKSGAKMSTVGPDFWPQHTFVVAFLSRKNIDFVFIIIIIIFGF